MEPHQINILIAEDNEVNRGMLSGIVKMQGYNVIEAADGAEAVNIARKGDIHVAVIDQIMEPKGGFHFAQYAASNGFKIPIIMVTAHEVSDILLEANKYGIERVIQKPVVPENLVSSISRILAQKGIRTSPLTSMVHSTTFSHEDLMHRAIELAAANRKSGKGGPFGAVVGDAEGHVIGEGTSGVSSRCDPVAHAEVMAIRQATEKRGKPDLEGCYLYCSSEPTKIGKALITSVGLAGVFYALKHSEIKDFLEKQNTESYPEYKRICHEDALAMLQACKKPEK
jgi:tRNA(Arg) A34 adenosine deaminase TadA/CheY-like chemotaxis protein